MPSPKTPHAYWTQGVTALVLEIPEQSIQIRIETPVDRDLTCFALMGFLSWIALPQVGIDLSIAAATLRAVEDGGDEDRITVSTPLTTFEPQDEDGDDGRRFDLTRKDGRCCVRVPNLGIHLILPCPNDSTLLAFNEVLPRFLDYCIANMSALRDAIFAPRSCPYFPDHYTLVWHDDVAYLRTGEEKEGEQDAYLGAEAELRPYAEAQASQTTVLAGFYLNILDLLDAYPNPNVVKPRPA